MPHFHISCTDKPDSAALRAQTRPAHLAHLQAAGDVLLFAGPLLDKVYGAPIGSILIIEAQDASAAHDFVAQDPYVQAGLFADVRITAIRPVLGAYLA